MVKRTISITLAFVLALGIFCVPVSASEAAPTPSAVLVNGKNVSFDTYSIDGGDYFKLRDLAYVLSGSEKQFDVDWDGAANAIILKSGKPYTTVGGEMAGKGDSAKVPEPTNSKILLDGKEIQLTAYLIDGNNYFRLRDVGKAIDFGVERDSVQNAIVIDTSRGYGFTLGYESRAWQPKTVDEFIPIFAQQYKRYNDVALEIWPGNTLHNVPYILEDVDTNRLWLVEPDGTVSDLPEDKAKEMGLVQRYKTAFTVGAFGDFYVYDSRGNIISQSFTADKFKGIYFTINKESLNDIKRWGKWPHVSTFDVLRFSIHESFHTFEQSKWQWQPVSERANYATKDQFFDATDARIKRDLIIKQLQAAVSSMGDKKLVLDVLATYADYKKNLNEDYVNALYWDRTEGTANYFELLSSIYTYFPDQIKSKDDAYRALAQLGTLDFYRLLVCGVIDEAYEIGQFTGVLLDMLGIDWKTQLMNDPMLTPMEILYQNFKNEILPEPKQAAQSEIDEVYKKMRVRKDGIIVTLKESIAGYEERLKTASEEDKSWLLNTIEYYKKRIEELSK